MGRKNIEAELLSKSLELIKNKNIIRSNDLPRMDMARLRKHGYLKQIINGWNYVTNPSITENSTTPFFMNYYLFLKEYLKENYKEYMLSVESALILHAQIQTIPKQLNVVVPNNIFNVVNLDNGYSLTVRHQTNMPTQEQLTWVQELPCPTIPYVLVQISPQHWATYGQEIQILLHSITLEDVLPYMTINKKGIERVVSGLKQIERLTLADDIQEAFEALNGDKLNNAVNPFGVSKIIKLNERPKTPIYQKIHLLWQKHRDTVIKNIPSSIPLCFKTPDDINQFIESRKIQDTYHSLSIEQYHVTEALIEAISKNQHSKLLEKNKDAMATKGYLEAFKLISKDAIDMYFQEQRTIGYSGALLKKRLRYWFIALWKPNMDAGILTQEQLIGYRHHHVFIMNSMHVPVHYDYISDAMEAYFECLEKEPDAFVRAVLGHWLLGYIHPYMDGNGRMARFVMNAMLTSGGYPWAIINIQNKNEYMAALAIASYNDDLEKFSQFIAHNVESGMHITPNF